MKQQRQVADLGHPTRHVRLPVPSSLADVAQPAQHTTLSGPRLLAAEPHPFRQLEQECRLHTPLPSRVGVGEVSSRTRAVMV